MVRECSRDDREYSVFDLEVEGRERKMKSMKPEDIEEASCRPRARKTTVGMIQY